jgi:hypothetical protein
MRTPLLLSLALTLTPGCLGGSNAIGGPTTTGDAGRTVWQISDGLCGAGLFGNDCDLNTRVVIGAAPLVIVRGRNGTSLVGATLVAGMGGGGTGVTITHFTTSSSDQGTELQANVQSVVAGSADVIVLDAGGHEIDRAHLTFATPSTLVCGNVTGRPRDLTFTGLANGPVAITEMLSDGGGSTTTTILGCRVSDASGAALLSVDAIQWSIGSGATGTVTITSDDVLGTTPAHGATARLVTSGNGAATVIASIGTINQSTSVTFR